MVDFLDDALRENGALRTIEGKSFLYLLCELAKSALVFPQRYKLRDIQCDFSQPQEGGSFADIFKGGYEKQKVCLKAVRLFRKQENTPKLRAHVKELILWAHLSHPNLLPFYGVYGGDGGSQRRCIVAPWMHNGTLADYLEAFPHSPRMVLVSDVAAGLAYLHQMGVVHGDIKAKNILISDDGRALIGDFGISRIMMTTGLASTRLSNGTTRWKAPELLINYGGNISPTFESDIWSFGCLCYEAFTRKVPFYQHNHDAPLLFAIVRQEVPSRPVGDQLDSIDDRMWGLMKRCFEYNPHNRPRCDEIWQFITDTASPAQQQVLPQLDLATPSSWDTMPEAIDHDRIHRILLSIRRDPHSAPAPLPVTTLKPRR